MAPKNGKVPGWLALSPILVFLLVYLLSSILLHDFYRVPVSSAFLLASAYAMAITPGNVEHKVKLFSQGASQPNILLMVWIFMMAGAFAGSAKEIGSIEATVNFTLGIVPVRMLLSGMFLTACFVSMAIGTSVGTIVALVPIAVGIADQTGMSPALMTALIVGGSFFGDNLSFISDTTIAATKAVGCRMSDKFKANFFIVLPAVIAVTAIYVCMGWNADAAPATGPVMWYALLPYVAVIVLAICGMNVITVLAIGIALNAVIGFAAGMLDWAGWLSSIGDGIAGMGDLVIVTLLACGMQGLIGHNGGMEYLTRSLMKHVHSRRGAELGIGLLTGAANLCTANNTIAIITTGGIVNDIAGKFGIEKKRAASLMDISSCFVQGLIPYGAQLLMAAGLTGLSALEIIPFLYYQFAAGICALLSVLLRRQ